MYLVRREWIISAKYLSKNCLRKSGFQATSWLILLVYARGKKKKKNNIFSLRHAYVSAHTSAHRAKWPRFASSRGLWNDRIYECAVTRRVEKSRDAASDSQRRHSLWDTRHTYEKISRTRISGTLAVAPHIYPFPISPMSRVVFVSRRKVDARTHELTDFHGSAPRHRDCASRDYVERTIPIRLAPGTGSNLCAPVSLLVLRSLRRL